jgi:excisionase family DNA binding protein
LPSQDDALGLPDLDVVPNGLSDRLFYVREGDSFPTVEVRAMEQHVEGRSGQGNPDRPLSPLLLTAEQAAATLAIGRTKIYELLRTGELESIQIGSSRRIPTAALEAYIEGLRQKLQPVAATRSIRRPFPAKQQVR